MISRERRRRKNNARRWSYEEYVPNCSLRVATGDLAEELKSLCDIGHIKEPQSEKGQARKTNHPAAKGGHYE